jgi:hypothetical protein
MPAQALVVLAARAAARTQQQALPAATRVMQQPSSRSRSLLLHQLSVSNTDCFAMHASHVFCI